MIPSSLLRSSRAPTRPAHRVGCPWSFPFPRFGRWILNTSWWIPCWHLEQVQDLSSHGCSSMQISLRFAERHVVVSFHATWSFAWFRLSIAIGLGSCGWVSDEVGIRSEHPIYTVHRVHPRSFSLLLPHGPSTVLPPFPFVSDVPDRLFFSKGIATPFQISFERETKGRRKEDGAIGRCIGRGPSRHGGHAEADMAAHVRHSAWNTHLTCSKMHEDLFCPS